jgi:lysophospholipase L1-like esterase
VSGHVEGVSGPVGWHAKAMTTSYLSSPGSAVSSDPTEAGFPHATTSWFLLDAVDAWCNTDHRTVVAFGDSLTDGTHTTLNGHDRWPDVLQRRLMHAGHPEIAVVNAGIGGNRIAGPAPGVPWRGGEAGATRLVRDVIGLSGVTAVIWLEGINDFTETADADVGEVLAALKQGVSRLRQSGLVVWGATVPSALHARRDGHGGVIQDRRRRTFNDALRHEAIFDHLIDVDAVLTDPVDGTLDRSCDLDSTTGGPGDGLHPGRTGHARMAGAIDIERLARVTRPQSSR